MARVGTTFLNLGKWLRGENPGAGSQTVDNLALNGNWIKLDIALGTQHNADGTHKSAIIHGNNINEDAYDGSTLEKDTSVNKARIKDAGVIAAKIATDAITTVKIIDDAITQAKMANDSVGTAEIINSNVTTAKIADSAVTSAKVASDEISIIHIFGDARVAGLNAGDIPATANEWLEQNASGDVLKIHTFYVKQKGDKYIKLKAHAKTNNAAKPWSITLNATNANGDNTGGPDGGSQEITGTNTSYSSDSAPNASALVSINTMDDGDLMSIKVYLKQAAITSTANMKFVCLYSTKG